ncbi:PAS domain S-box-containing protein [Sphingobium sp. B1D7B]|uniref:response regulator n=1 Tax=unclassified Sphingobium TaxID=2611147 RepID=UPI0022254D1B|nr:MULTISPECIES: response regulator [unclassified Sphingobium]MCW2392084.1 PAS domain S-box-containing protein [Sphingobium sp. B11D3A]MCW2403791.1 PAS domain S-box-containing protein [Sphingobium sp. B1D7B]
MSPDPVRILIVDDVVENLEALEALLAHDGVETARAGSGAEALELLLVNEFALALLDVQMPGMDGFELAELMRGTERTRRIPIIFLTAVATDETRRFRGYEAGAVDYLLKPIDSLVLRSKVEVFVELHRHRQALARHGDELSRALGRLQAHRDNSPLAIVEFDDSERIVGWSKGAERMFGWSEREMLGGDLATTAWSDADGTAPLHSLFADFRAGVKQRDMLSLVLHSRQGTDIDTECYCSAVHGAGGRLLSVEVQILDVTERRRAEKTQRLLVGELNHRVKNTMASVQAIASQTLRHSADPADFAPTFIGRIHALSKAHSLLSEATWKAASLRELIHGQFDMGVVGPDRLSATGPDVDLEPEPSLHLSMVLHELVTNALKYGALSTAEGQVALNWTLEDEQLHLEWVERGGPPVSPPSRTGFGSMLIERSLRSEGGASTATYEPEGLRWTLTLPCAVVRKSAPAAIPRTAPQPVLQVTTEGSLDGKSVLVVEDEPLVALDILTVLGESGAQVIGPVTTHDQALEQARTGQFDLVLLDGNLQGETVEDIAALLQARAIPFLMVSGYGAAQLPDLLARQPIVTKPFSAEELLRAARSLLAPSPAMDIAV